MVWQPTKVDVALTHLRHNYREIVRKIPAGQKPVCIVKSNAYGHGLVPVAQALETEGADFFGVRSVEEGIALRKGGVKGSILILLGIIEEGFAEVVEFNLTPVVTRLEVARAFHDYLEGNQQKHPIHVKVDTGMSRLGIPFEQAGDFFDALKKLPALQVTGVLSHLAEATDPEYTTFQKKNFLQLREQLTESGWKIDTWHLGNSTCAIRSLLPEFERVRLGIALYGSYPDPDLKDEIDLQPALTWTTHILETKEIPAGRAVSYGCTFVTQRPTRIGLLPVGYADGYPRLLSNRGKVLVAGEEAPILGRVCMDLSIIDLTDIPKAQSGDTVTLIGCDQDKKITAEEVATWAETISYEIFTRIADRIPRHYQG